MKLAASLTVLPLFPVLAALLLSSAQVYAWPSKGSVECQIQRGDFRGKVVYVDDGDTVTILNAAQEQVKVRLSSIDAPELSHTNKEIGRIGQPYADNSKRYLEGLVKGRTVDAKCPDTDRYGRAVCDLAVDGRSANEAMVRMGWAWANEAARGRYMRDGAVPGLEAAARRARVGLWAGVHPVAPWEWRKACWEQHHCPN